MRLPNPVVSPTPVPAFEGGVVLAAGQARGPEAKAASNPKPSRVEAFSTPPRVRCVVRPRQRRCFGACQ